MPYTIEMDLNQRRVWFKALGVYSQADAFQSIQDMLNHPHFEAGFDVLVDMSEVQDVSLWGADVRDKVEFDRTLIDSIGAAKWAFVAPTDLVFGLARMYQALMDDSPIQVNTFRDLHAAQAWLDTDEAR